MVPDRSNPLTPDDRPSEFILSLYDLASGQVRNELENALSAQLPRTLSIMQPKSKTNAPKLLEVNRLTDDKIRAMFARGEEFSKDVLDGYSFTLPTGDMGTAIERALARVVDHAGRCLSPANPDSLRFRANIFVPRAQKLVIAYSHGMDDDQDRHLEFRFNAGLTGFCFLNRRPFLCNLRYTRQWAMQEQAPDATLLGMNRDDHLAVREDRTWLASVPIFDPMDCWFHDDDTPRMPRDPEELAVWADVTGVLDGALFGVLNIDGAIPYAELNLEGDPEHSLTDPRIASIFNSLQACSFEIGRIFSRSFGKRES